MSKLQYEFFTGNEANILEQHKLDESIRFPWPENSHILYAIDEDKNIVGRMGLLQLPHIEGTWIDEKSRSGLIGARMLAKMENLLIEHNRTAAFAFVKDENAEDIKIQEYMERFGYIELPIKVYIKALVNEEKVA